MALATVKKGPRGLWPMLLLFAMLLVSLSFMSDATDNSERFGRLYSLLLLTNAIGLLVLATMIGSNLYWLVIQQRKKAAGARLTARLVGMFVILAVLPVSMVYYFSLQFLHRGIDSWFDVQVETALEDALALSKASFDVRLRDLLHQTQLLAEELTDVPAPLAPLSLYDLRVGAGATELTLVGDNGRVIASSGLETSSIVPDIPSEDVLLQLRSGASYVGLDPAGEAGLQARAVVPVPSRNMRERRVLQALFSLPEHLADQADRVQAAYTSYKELAYLRTPLKHSYTLTLSVVLALSVLSAVWAAFYAARKLVAPVSDLAEATQAVADGDYSNMLEPTSNDELGFLVKSFNMMTRRLGMARDEAYESQRQVEGQRTYLETLLGNLSSGVMSLSADRHLRTANSAAAKLLAVPLRQFIGKRFTDVLVDYDFLKPLSDAIMAHELDESRQWQEELTLLGDQGRQVLICRGARLPNDAGLVLVFDDVTALIQAQRDAAWGEVARRLAHEIKNPLTPIQLSAERLRHKCMPKMAPEHRDILDRATHTIVQQVEAMKAMVNDFSDYARMPQMQVEPLTLNVLVKEVMELYRGGRGSRFALELDAQEPVIEADANRLRQLLHNLVKNAKEATAKMEKPQIRVATRVFQDRGMSFVELSVADNGPGFDEAIKGKEFEPYVTSKSRGTGLGLSIVKKIVEEHGGVIRIGNQPQGGAAVRIHFPVHRLLQATGMPMSASEH